MAQTDIPATIRAQLGEQAFVAMTGARSFLALPTLSEQRGGLQFDLPARLAQDGINRVRIALTNADTYTVQFLSYRPRTLREVLVYEASDVYANQLRAIFTRCTGLDCGGLR